MTQDNDQHEEQGGLATISRPKVQEPPRYLVLLLNDDYSTMDFVIHVLQKFFHKTPEEANRLMLKVHHEGKAPCGTYPKDVAETKVTQVNGYSRQNEMPLKCAMEPV